MPQNVSFSALFVHILFTLFPARRNVLFQRRLVTEQKAGCEGDLRPLAEPLRPGLELCLRARRPLLFPPQTRENAVA
jgi:hypothetical protein